MAYEHNTDMTRVSALIKIKTRDVVNQLADKESRSFSSMADVLLAEAVEARNKYKNAKK